MKTICLFFVSIPIFSWAHPEPKALPDCAALVEEARWELAQGEDWVLVEEADWAILEETSTCRSPLLEGLTLPAGFTETQAQFEADRALARTLILPSLAALRRQLALLSPKTQIHQMLHSLAFKWEASSDVDERRELMNAMDELFRIDYEDFYLDLIAKGRYSLELKEALYEKLAARFGSAPAWKPYLDHAIETADPQRAAAKRALIAQNPGKWRAAPPLCSSSGSRKR